MAKDEAMIAGARALRRNATKQENHLWYDYLRNYPLQFSRQRIFGGYIVDFYCSKAKLVVELDGSQHLRPENMEYDNERTKFLNAYGFRVIRFPNSMVDNQFSAVCAEIDKAAKAPFESKGGGPKGRGNFTERQQASATLRLSAARPRDISLAASLLRAGLLVAIPTETVYGLAANALDEQAVAKIFEAKGRPQDNPLIVHVEKTEDILPLIRGEIPEKARLLAEAFWPGPLTLILPKSHRVPGIVSAELDTVALRAPSHPAARALLREAGIPLAAPSANRSGSPSPTLTKHVLADLEGRIAAVLDGGPCAVGVESTVLSLAGEIPCLLRPGAVTPARIEEVIGPVKLSRAVNHEPREGKAVSSPGMKYEHYAPKAELLLLSGSFGAFARYVKEHARPGDGLLCFDEDEDIPGLPRLNYGAGEDSAAQAARIFARLRELDELGLRRVYVRCPGLDGIGLAVYNRLLRAARFRLVELERPVFPGSSFYFIGLAGKSGAGKSEAARLLREMGCAVLDGDQLAREATLPGSPVLKELAEAFGADILRGDGSLDRALLAERAFRSEEKRRILNDITHPAIAELMEERVRALPEDTPAVVIDAAALHESEYAARCDRLLILTAPEETCLRRILAREGISGEAARRRLAAQRHWEQERPGALYYHNDDKASLEDMRSFLKGVLRDARRA